MSWLFVCLCASTGLGQTVTLLLTADTKGHLEPCADCPRQEHGGLARRGTLLSEQRAKDPSLLLIDAGNAFYGPDSLASRGAVVADAYQTLGYDAVNLSYRDFRLGKAATLELLEGTRLPVISANLMDETTDRLLVKPFVVEKVGSTRIALIGVSAAPPGIALLPHLKRQLDGVRVRPAAEALAEWLPRAEAESDRVVLVYYGSHRKLGTIRDQFGERLWVILIGSVRGRDLPTETTPRLVGTGDRGRQLASVRLDLDGKTVTVEQITVRADLPADPSVHKILEKHRPAPPVPSAPETLPADDRWIPPTVDGRIDLADHRNGGRVVLPGTQDRVSCSVNRHDLKEAWQSEKAAPCSLFVSFAEQQRAHVDRVVLVPASDRPDGWPTQIKLYSSEDGQSWELMAEKDLPGSPARATIDLVGRQTRYVRVRFGSTVGGDRPRLAAIHVLSDPSRSIVAYGRPVNGPLLAGEENLLQNDAGGKMIGVSAGFQTANHAGLIDGFGNSAGAACAATQPGTQQTRHLIGGAAGAMANRFVLDQRRVAADRRMGAVMLVDRSDPDRPDLIGYYVLAPADLQVLPFQPRQLRQLEVSYIPEKANAMISVAEIGLIKSDREVAAVIRLPEPARLKESDAADATDATGSRDSADKPRTLTSDPAKPLKVEETPEESLRRTCAEILALLKSENYRKVIVDYAEPAQVKKLGTEKLEQVIEQFRRRSGKLMAATLEKAKSAKPVFSEGETKATFSIAGAPSGGLTFRRIGRRWYLVN